MKEIALFTRNTSNEINILVKNLSDIIDIKILDSRIMDKTYTEGFIIIDIDNFNVNDFDYPYIIFTQEHSSINISPVNNKNFLGILNINSDIDSTKSFISDILKSIDKYFIKTCDLFETSQDAIIIWDKNSYVLDINESAGKFLLLNKEDVVGKRIDRSENWVLYDSKGLSISKFSSIFKNHTSYTFGLSIFGGDIKWIRTNISTVKYTNGEILYYYASFSDITEERLKAERMNILSIAMDHSPVGVVVTDPDGVIQSFNPKFKEISGYSDNELLGQKPNIFKNSNSKTNYERLWNTISKGFIWKGQFVNQKKDGSLYTESAIISPVFNYDNKIIHYIAIKEDMTNLISTEQKLKKTVAAMKDILKTKKRDLQIAQELTLESLAILAEYRDNETGEHIQRTKSYVKYILEKLKFKYNFSTEEINQISNSSSLHDIGKVAIPDNILLKPGKLSYEEFEKMKEHTKFGNQVLNRSIKEVSDHNYLRYAQDITLYHHEKWNGKGYPYQLQGEDIPLVARIMAIADVYDALRSERPYKKGLSHGETVEYIVSESGKHFDPELVDLFEKNHFDFDILFIKTNEVSKILKDTTE